MILSEFAGLAVELPYAILTNPYDPKSLKETLLQAVLLTDEEKQMRMNRLYDHVKHYDINFRADDFINQLSSFEPDDEKIIENIPQKGLKGFSLPQKTYIETNYDVL